MNTTSPSSSPPRAPIAWRITVIYLLIDGLWILLSDQLVAALIRDPATLTTVSTLKGWGYIGVTGLLYYWLIHRATLALYASEERYRQLFENSPIGIYRTTPDGRILAANPALVQMLGYESFEELARRSLESASDATDSRNNFKQQVERAGRIAGLEAEWRRRDGSTIFIRESAQVIRDEHGAVLYYDGNVEDITERKRVDEEIHRRASEFSALFETAHDLMTYRDLPALLQTIVERAVTLLNASGGFVYLFDAARHDLELTVETGVPATPGIRLRLGEGMAGRVAQSHQPLMVDNYQTWEGRASIYEDMPYHAIIEVPMLFGGELIGVLGASELGDSVRKFGEADARLLSLFAALAASAVHNARLLEAEREQRVLAEALRGSSAALNSTLDPDEVIARILSNVGRIVPNDGASVLEIEDDIARLVRAVGYHDPDKVAAMRGLSFRLSQTPNLHQMAVTGQPLAIPDTTAYPEWVDVPGSRWIQSNVGAPLQIKGRVVGIIILDSATPNFYTPVHAERLQLFAAQAATAIENARLFAETQQRVKELATLFESSLAITASLDRATVLRTISQRLTEVVDATSVYILSCDLESSSVTVIAEYFGPDAHDRERMSDRSTTLSRREYPETIARLRAGQPAMAVISQPESDPVAAAQMEEYGGKSSLRVPMMIAGTMRGYAVIWDTRTERAWTDAEVRLCQTLANQAAIALENVRLFEETQKRLTEQSALLAATTAVASSLDLPIMLQRLAEQMGRAIDATSAYICNWNSQSETATVLADYYSPVASPAERVSDLGVTYHVREDLGLDVDRLRAQLAIVLHVDDPALSEQRREHMLRYGGQSALAIPLVVKDAMIGYTEIWESRQRREFTLDEISLCRGIAQQAALAFDNTRLFDAERKQLRLAQTLQAVGALLTAEMRLDDVFNYLFDLLARVVDYDSVSVQIVDGDQMHLAAGRGLLDIGAVDKSIRSIAQQTIEDRWGPQHRRVIVIPDTHRNPHWALAPGNEYIRSWIGAALRVKGRLLGILNVDSKTVNAYDDELGETVAAFANQAAVAIENAQLHDAVRRHADELEQRVIERTAELERERKRTAAILDTAGEGIMLTDANGFIQYVNPAMQRITGFSSDEAIGQNPRIWQSGSTSPAFYYQMWTRIKRGEIWQGELVNRRKDGSLYDAALTIAPLNDDDGRIAAFVGVQRDITRQKELERLKDEFVSNVSHELRTPIANVKLYLSLLTRGKPERYDEYLQTLHRETARLQKLIEDLLDLSRIDLGRTEMELMPIDLHQLTAQIIADRSAMAASRHLTIDYQTETDTVVAYADTAQLVQVISNLLTNAINYTPPGGLITVTIAQRQADGQTWATFTVKDTGAGINPIDLSHLFERFYRGEAGRKSGAPGTGLGLAISRKITERMGGRITVESAPSRGAAFTVWLRTE